MLFVWLSQPHQPVFVDIDQIPYQNFMKLKFCVDASLHTATKLYWPFRVNNSIYIVSILGTFPDVSFDKFY